MDSFAAPRDSIALDYHLTSGFERHLGEDSPDGISARLGTAHPAFPTFRAPQLLFQGIETAQPEQKHPEDRKPDVGCRYLLSLPPVPQLLNTLTELIALLQIAGQTTKQ